LCACSQARIFAHKPPPHTTPLIGALYENSKHMTPTEFEQEIAKLEEALKGRNATVT